jgi:3',5'-cyclic AMP phosphodiesterase CpdA
MIRLAHYSDIHVTVPPLGQPASFLAGKRVMGALNYYFGGRRRHFEGVDGRIAALLADIDAQGVDHAICTGDVTQMSYAIEFERLGALFGDRRNDPARHTVIPGNHDRYTHGASEEHRFEKALGAIAPDHYPFVKALGPRIDLVSLDVSRPNAMLDSSGLCGAEQLEKLGAILADPARMDRLVIVALHYGFFRRTGRPDNRMHGLRDADALLGLLRSCPQVQAVLHGHIHGAFEIPGVPRILNAGSATDLAHHPGYNIYAIDPEQRTIAVQRRLWQDGQFVDGVLPIGVSIAAA